MRRIIERLRANWSEMEDDERDAVERVVMICYGLLALMALAAVVARLTSTTG